MDIDSHLEENMLEDYLNQKTDTFKDKLKNKKITMATLKSFINKSNKLFVEEKSSFCGMTDCVQSSNNTELKPVSKENAIGHDGVYCVGSGRDYFRFQENEKFYGIEVYNSCGRGILWTEK